MVIIPIGAVHFEFFPPLSLHVPPLTDFLWPFRRSKYDILMEHVSNFLQRSPGQVSSIITLKEQLVSLSVDV